MVRYDDFQSLKWAVDFLIPTADMIYVMKKGKDVNIKRISELFRVTEQFVVLKYLILFNSEFDLKQYQNIFFEK